MGVPTMQESKQQKAIASCVSSHANASQGRKIDRQNCWRSSGFGILMYGHIRRICEVIGGTLDIMTISGIKIISILMPTCPLMLHLLLKVSIPAHSQHHIATTSLNILEFAAGALSQLWMTFSMFSDSLPRESKGNSFNAIHAIRHGWPMSPFAHSTALNTLVHSSFVIILHHYIKRILS